GSRAISPAITVLGGSVFPPRPSRCRPASPRRLSDCWRRVWRPTGRQENYPPRKALKSQETRKSSGRLLLHRPAGGGSEAAAPRPAAAARIAGGEFGGRLGGRKIIRPT